MSDARDVIAEALSDQLPSDSRYDIGEVTHGVVVALADAAGGRYVVIDTMTGTLVSVGESWVRGWLNETDGLEWTADR